MTQSASLRHREDLLARRIRYRGQGYWTIKDPLALRFYQLRDEEYFILRQLDGQTSLQQIQARFQQHFAPQRLSLEQLHWFLGALHREALVVGEAPGQGAELLARRRRQQRLERWGRAANLLAIRFRGVDPDPLLDTLYPLVRWMFSPLAIASGCILVLAALAWSLLHLETLLSRLPDLAQFFSLANVFWLAVSLAVVKVAHELAHGLTCKHFGGQCRELGLMLLVFTPCLYCNVSDAWMVPSKWRRMAISAAGMYLELVIAAVALFGWWFSQPGLLHAICLNLVVVCSVATVFFNGNPLLRYDGYFILSDLLETPNLNEQATGVIRRPLSRWLWGIELPTGPLEARHHRGWLVVYAVAAWLYRLVLIVAILWLCYSVLVAYRLELLWQVLAVSVVAGALAPPAWRTARFLRDPRRRRQLRPGRAAVSTLLAAVMLTLVLLVPLPRHVWAPALLQPVDAAQLFIDVPGRLVDAAAAGEQVQPQQVVARLENPELETEVVRLQGQVQVQQLLVQTLERRQVHDPRGGVAGAMGQLPSARAMLADLQQRLARRLEDQQRLTITAPRAGTMLPPRHRAPETDEDEIPSWTGSPLDVANRGCFLERGTQLGLIADPRQLESLLIVPQHAVAAIRPGQHVRLRLAELPQTELSGRILSISPTDQQRLPDELVAEGLVPAASPTPANPTPRPTYPSYEVRVQLEPIAAPLPIRLVGQARIEVDPQNLLTRLSTYLKQTFQAAGQARR